MATLDYWSECCSHVNQIDKVIDYAELGQVEILSRPSARLGQARLPRAAATTD